MKEKILAICCAALAAALFIISGMAPAAAEEEYRGSYNLEEIVVSAPGYGVEATETVREVTKQDIENKGARNLDQSVNLVPGVDIMTGGDGTPRVNIRGFRSRHTLLLVDGIPYNSTFDGQFDPTLIPVENIDKIKVTAGSSSVLYGQGALAGVVNIITRRGQQGLHGMVAEEDGTAIRHYERFSLSGAKDKVDFFVSGSSFKTDGFVLSNDFKAHLRGRRGPAGKQRQDEKQFFCQGGLCAE